MKCKLCKRPMVPCGYLDDEARAAGMVEHNGRGLCSTDYKRMKRAGKLNRFGSRARPQVPIDTVVDRFTEAVEENPWQSLAEIARHVGVDRPALSQAMIRARNRGEAWPHLRQELRTEQVLADWEHMADQYPAVRLNTGHLAQGWAAEPAERMGITPRQLVSILETATLTGDPRARIIIDETRSASRRPTT